MTGFRALRWMAAPVLLVIATGPVPARAGAVLDRVLARGEVSVCIWPAYQRITFRDPRSGQLSGLDVELAAALATDLQVRLRFVDSSFMTLASDLLNDACDVAMFGVAMSPQRMERLKFSAPYLQSGIYAVTTRTSPLVRKWDDIDQPGIMVGVQAGTFMEPVMRQHLRHARLVSIQPPQTRERELQAGRVDVFMADYPYGRSLAETTDWAALLGPAAPFHPLPYAYPVKPGDAQWLATLDVFVESIRRDGRLDAAARRHGLDHLLRPAIARPNP